MVILQPADGPAFMQGDTNLLDGQTILYNGKKQLSISCNCGKPFAESILEIGIILDTVMCASCGKEQAHIVQVK